MAPVLLNPFRYGSASAGGRAAFAAKQIADGALAEWGMDETSGTTRTDGTGNGRNLTSISTISAGTSLHSDGDGHSMALAKSSGAGYATIASAAWQYPTAVTLECLVYFTGAPGSSGDALIWKGVNYRIWRDSTRHFTCDLSNAAGATKTIHSTAVLADNTLYHLVLTKDNTNLQLYVGAVLVADLANNIGLGAGSSAAGSPGSGIYAGAAVLTVGRATGDASIPTGLIDSTAIYGGTTMQTQAQIAARTALI